MHIEEVTVETLLARIEKDSTIRLIDVRTSQEWAGGIADISDFGIQTDTITLMKEGKFDPNFIEKLNAIVGREEKLYFICFAGERSRIAAGIAKQSGYKYCFNISCGMKYWVLCNKMLCLPKEKLY